MTTVNLPALTNLIDHLDAEIDLISTNLERLQGELAAAQREDLADPDEKQVKGAALVRATLAIDRKRLDNAVLVDRLMQAIAMVQENLTDKVFTRDRLVKLRDNMARLAELLEAVNLHTQATKEAWDAAQAFIESDIDSGLHREIFDRELFDRFGVQMNHRWTQIRLTKAGHFIIATQEWWREMDQRDAERAKRLATPQTWEGSDGTIYTLEA